MGVRMKTAKWIWLRSENRENTWMCFAKDFVPGKPSEPWVLRVAADSKYWLYINGQTVLREGGLKRGRSPHSTYCDEIDISGFLAPGVNRLAVLVWYMGRDGFSHLSSGRARAVCGDGFACGQRTGFGCGLESKAASGVSSGAGRRKRTEFQTAGIGYLV